MSAGKRLEPGSAVGVLGGGQLGRMLALVAARMGYRVHSFAPSADGPAAQVAQREVVAPWDDHHALRRFGADVDVVTIEFENIPVAALEAAGANALLRPPSKALHVAQNRAREKAFLAELGVPVAPHAHIREPDQLEAAFARIGAPAILKSAGFGYDGKGQRRLGAGATLADARAALDGVGAPAVLEGLVDFEREFSQIVARGVDGEVRFFDPIENVHVGGVLDASLAPARLAPEHAAAGREIAAAVAAALDYVGVLCVEFFATADGPVANEFAPRPHNSGHLTLEAAVVSQFEQQLRAACGLPLGDPSLRQPAAMVNLLGDLWQPEPNWPAVHAADGVRLHLYGKREPRPGRKMGHLTRLGSDAVQLADELRAVRDRLVVGGALG